MPFKEAYIQKSSVGFILKKHKDKNYAQIAGRIIKNR